MTGAFAIWQPQYAAHRVVTFPVDIGRKKPAVSNFMEMGPKASLQLAMKFPGAASFGFVSGKKNRLTIVDIDSTDEAVLRESERLFGSSPVIWRTGSGHFAAAYRYHGERRLIRAFGKSGPPIDLLGEKGFVVAPGSAGARRPYEFIRGGLADFDRLPHARIPKEIANTNTPLSRDRTSPSERIPEGQRENELFIFCRRIVWHCDNLDALLDAARTWAADHLDNSHPPFVTDNDIVSTCESVWRYRGGRKRMMGSNIFIEPEKFKLLHQHPYALALCGFLAATQGFDANFMVADGMRELLGPDGWPLRAIPAARKQLLDWNIIECVRPRAPGRPALYRWVVSDDE
jgi:hypothetical protein